MKVEEVPFNQTIAEALFLRYQKQIQIFSFKGSKIQLRHDLDLPRLKTNIDQIMDLHGRHPWQSSDDVNLRYTGFSINYNPDHQDNINPNASSLGTPKNKRDQFYYNATASHDSIKNSYFDCYGFIQRTPAASEGYLAELLDTCKRTIVRSRMMILDGRQFDEATITAYAAAKPGDSKFGWHRDEPIYVNLRINIPIVGDDSFVFEMVNQEPYFLESGFAYTWDTNIPHRVWCRRKSEAQRYNLIIGVSPWFDFHPGTKEWLPNEFCGRMSPIEMLCQGHIFDWLRLK
jgi:hypothetical protein